MYHGAALVRELMRAATPRAQCTTQEHRLTHVIAATHFVAIARMVASVTLQGGQRGSESKVEGQDVKWDYACSDVTEALSPAHLVATAALSVASPLVLLRGVAKGGDGARCKRKEWVYGAALVHDACTPRAQCTINVHRQLSACTGVQVYTGH